MSSVNTATAPILTAAAPNGWLGLQNDQIIEYWRTSDFAVGYFSKHGEPATYEQYLASKQPAQEGSPVVA